MNLDHLKMCSDTSHRSAYSCARCNRQYCMTCDHASDVLMVKTIVRYCQDWRCRREKELEDGTWLCNELSRAQQGEADQHFDALVLAEQLRVAEQVRDAAQAQSNRDLEARREATKALADFKAWSADEVLEIRSYGHARLNEIRALEDRIQTIADEAFGPFPAQTVAENLTAIERGVAYQRRRTSNALVKLEVLKNSQRLDWSVVVQLQEIIGTLVSDPGPTA